MQPHLVRSEVRRWLEGQREAERVIRRERISSLRSRSTDEAWAIYLSLTDSRLGDSPDAHKPSYLLTAMRRALDRRPQRMQISL